jgi:hypothetical protein
MTTEPDTIEPDGASYTSVTGPFTVTLEDSGEQLAAAWVKACAELVNPAKDAKADTGKYAYTYLTLDTLLDHVRPVLARHSLAVWQDVTNDSHLVTVTTILVHASGQERAFGPMVWPITDNVQHFGGLVSYLKRYSLTAALGIAAGEDDDATQATIQSLGPRQSTSGPLARSQSTRPASDKSIGLLKGLMREHGLSEIAVGDLAGFTPPEDGLPAWTQAQVSAGIDTVREWARKQAERHDGPPPGDDPWQDPA